jgi:hypothetical protein
LGLFSDLPMPAVPGCAASTDEMILSGNNTSHKPGQSCQTLALPQLEADDWDTQMMFFLGHGFRVIAHDRRGHG